MKTKAAELIEQEIKRRGPMTFARFIDLALYHPTYGYYSRSVARRGRSGDYFTSLQVSPLFASIFADALSAMRERLDSDHFHLIEVASGGGEFLETLLGLLEREKKLKGLHVWAVDKSRAARDLLFRRLSRFPKTHVVSSIDEVETVGGLEGCIFSNEFFDAIPFHRLVVTASGFRELWVSLKEGEMVEEAGPLSEGLQGSVDALGAVSFVRGQQIELRPEAESTMAQWGSLINRGFVVTVDYGYPREELFRPDRLKGTWFCYRKHEAHERIFEAIGDQDITAHVDFTRLARAGLPSGLQPALFCSQGVFLSHVGRERIERVLANPPGGTLPGGNLKDVSSSIQQLIHPEAMGEKFWTLIHAKGIKLPDLFAGIPNRLRRLGCQLS